MALVTLLTSDLRVRSNEDLASHSRRRSLSELYERKRYDHCIDERLKGAKFIQQLTHYHRPSWCWNSECGVPLEVWQSGNIVVNMTGKLEVHSHRKD
jgi:hypothetical protein